MCATVEEQGDHALLHRVRRRPAITPFDICVGGRARADEWEGERAPTQAVAAAGATWWMEFISLADCAGHEGYVFFALLDDAAKAVGFVVILPHQQEGVSSVGPVYVGSGYRGKGLGRRLIEETIRWAKGKEIRRLFTKTWGGNTRSRRLFEGVGFRMVQEEPDTRVNGDSTVEYFLKVG